MKPPKDVDAYLAAQSPEARRALEELRACIRKVAPRAAEMMNYDIPAFAERLAAYKFSKGSVQFPLDQPIPKTLVTAMVKARLAQLKA